jgi:hypothetical protein
MSGGRVLGIARRVLTRVVAVVVTAVGAGLIAAPAVADPSIDHLSKVSAGRLVAGDVAVGLDGDLAVVLKLDPGTVVDAEHAVLFLDGRAITGLTGTIYSSNDKALIFHLVRNDDNKAAWQPLLAAPGLKPRSVAVGIWLTKPDPGNKTPPPPLARADGVQPTFDLVVLSPRSLVAGAVAVLLVMAAVWAGATKTNILKDALLPQLAPEEQTYSLGRSQMAFWFTLIFAAFVFLFFMLWDYNTLTTQSLVLMGLSGATSIFSVAVDAAKDTPIGAANETLRAIGLRTYDDVLRLDQEIAERQAGLKNTPSTDADTILKLRTEISDRLNKKRSWRELTRPFVSQGWYRDLTTDNNGPALHRLQMFVWTLAIGVLFIVEVYRSLALPEFSATLLALMGITSASYIGFKYPEKQY